MGFLAATFVRLQVSVFLEVSTSRICRWAAEQAKARELGDVVDFVRDLNLEKEKEHHVD